MWQCTSIYLTRITLYFCGLIAVSFGETEKSMVILSSTHCRHSNAEKGWVIVDQIVSKIQQRLH